MQPLQSRQWPPYRKLRALTALRAAARMRITAPCPRRTSGPIRRRQRRRPGLRRPAGRLDGGLYDSATPSHRLTVIYAAVGAGNERLLWRSIAHTVHFIRHCVCSHCSLSSSIPATCPHIPAGCFTPPCICSLRITTFSIQEQSFVEKNSISLQLLFSEKGASSADRSRSTTQSVARDCGVLWIKPATSPSHKNVYFDSFFSVRLI